MKRRQCTCGLIEPTEPELRWRSDKCPICAARPEPKPETMPEPKPVLVRRDATADRLTARLADCNRRYPELWRTVDAIRAERSQEWPRWCFIPLAHMLDYFFATAPQVMEGAAWDALFQDMDALPGVAALAAWRPTQGIYRFDPELAEALWDTPPNGGKLPIELFDRLPDWCCYCEFPAATPPPMLHTDNMRGFFVGRFAGVPGRDLASAEDLLLFAVDSADTPDLITASLVLRNTVEESIEATLETGARPEGASADDIERILPLVSMALYLCSDDADMPQRDRTRPRPVKTKRGLRLFPPDVPRVWECGFRIGAAIRKAGLAGYYRDRGGTHASPRPHIRRAHWHSFWTGPKATAARPVTDRKLVAHWIPPTPVNTDAGEVVPTIYPVNA